MEERGLELARQLLGCGIGWLTAMAICGVFHWLRGIAPRQTAFPGMGIACFWLLGDFIALYLAISSGDRASILNALLSFLPFVVAAGVALWHKATLGLSRSTAFAILMVEAVVALVIWVTLFYPYETAGRTLSVAEPGLSHLYLPVLPVLLLTLIVEEIAGPVRRRARTEFVP